MLPSPLPSNTGDGVLVLNEILAFLVILGLIGVLAWLGHELLAWRRERPAALIELEARYARGEIDRDDFYTRRADIIAAPQMTASADSSMPPPPPPLA